MKIEVNIKDEFTYPVLMRNKARNKATGKIVYFMDYDHGVCLSKPIAQDWKPSMKIEDWIPATDAEVWDKLHGSISFSNECCVGKDL